MPARPRIALSLCTAFTAVLVLHASAAQADDATGSGRQDCKGSSAADIKLRVDPDGEGRFVVSGTVWSDDTDVWTWRMLHNDEVSYKGDVQARDADKSFKIQRSMVDLAGTDTIAFRAENTATDEVCRTEVAVS